MTGPPQNSDLRIFLPNELGRNTNPYSLQEQSTHWVFCRQKPSMSPEEWVPSHSSAFSNIIRAEKYESHLFVEVLYDSQRSLMLINI
jgi:hypothetical protein